MKHKPTLFLAAFLLSACASESPDLKSVYIDSQPVICTGEGQQMCLRVKHDEDQQWQRHYSGIQGFDYEWGYTYNLAYIESEVKNPPADGSSVQWVLLQTISQKEDDIGAEYHFERVNLQGSPITFTNGEYAFMEYPFVCAASLDCDTLLGLSGSNRDVALEFRYLGNAQIELVNWQ